jgi:hypothetical protein
MKDYYNRSNKDTGYQGLIAKVRVVETDAA